MSEVGEGHDRESVEKFIEKYLSNNHVRVTDYVSNYQKDWDSISDTYNKKAESIFGVSLSQDVIAYLTINNRCSYSINDNFFFVTVPNSSVREIVMHELWHFYTWYKFGIIWEEKIGKQKYNDLKEALTVLLNIECAELFPGDAMDYGYPQHQELRNLIKKIWQEEGNIDRLWEKLIIMA